MMVLFNFRRSRHAVENGGGDARNHLRTRPDAPFWRASIATLQADGLSPLRRRPGITCWRAAATAVWREYRPPLALWQPGFPGEWRCPASGSLRRLDFNIMTQRGRASATVQVVSDLQCPASEGSPFYKARIWPGDAARPAAASAGAVDPAESASLGSNGRLLLAEIALK